MRNTRRTLAVSMLVLAVLLAGGPLAAGSGDPINVRGIHNPPVRVGPDLSIHPPAQRAALRPVRDCDGLRGYLTDVILDTIVQVRYGVRSLPWLETPDAGAGGGAPSDFTTTNVQEAGVDELDVVKTDGLYLYVANNDGLAVVRSWPPESSALVASLPLSGTPDGLFLRGDTAAVISSQYGFLRGGFAPVSRTNKVIIDMVGLTERDRPQAARTITIEGRLVGARMIDGQVYAVVSSSPAMPEAAWELVWRDDLGLPELSPDATEADREAAMARAREILQPLVESIMAGIDPRDSLPTVSDTASPLGKDAAAPLLGCGDVFAPAETETWGVLSVVHVDLDRPLSSPVDAVGVLADGFTVYASARSLYVAQQSWWWSWRFTPETEMSTVVHRFDLGALREGGKPVRYAATGEVSGWLIGQFSMGELNGYLRVATTRTDWWWGGIDDRARSGSLVTVLHNDGRGVLREIGRLEGIAPGEQLYAARFMGTKGYLVTFRQLDPLFVLDLSDPASPRITGELEVTGYSSYLHPMDDDHLLAVGMEADQDGHVLGLAVSVFDVSDPSAPELSQRYLVENDDQTWSWSDALADHHAFTFYHGVLSIPAYVGSSAGPAFSGLLVLSVDADAGIAELGRIDHADLPPPVPDPYGGFVHIVRSVDIEGAIYSLSTRGIKVNLLDNPDTEIARVPFYPAAGGS